MNHTVFIFIFFNTVLNIFFISPCFHLRETKNVNGNIEILEKTIFFNITVFQKSNRVNENFWVTGKTENSIKFVYWMEFDGIRYNNHKIHYVSNDNLASVLDILKLLSDIYLNSCLRKCCIINKVFFLSDVVPSSIKSLFSR